VLLVIDEGGGLGIDGAGVGGGLKADWGAEGGGLKADWGAEGGIGDCGGSR